MLRLYVFRVWGALAALLTLAVGVWYLSQPSPERLQRMARYELAKQHFAAAEQLAIQASTGWRASPQARLIAAEAALKDDRPAAALAHYCLIPDHLGETTVAAQFGMAEAQLQLRNLVAAEANLRHVVELAPHHVAANHHLAYLLSATGRRWQANPYLLELIKRHAAKIGHLLLLGNSEKVFEDHQVVALVRAVDDDLKNPWPAVGAARTALSLNEPTKARSLLEPLAQHFPDEPEIQVSWAEVLVVLLEWDEFARWNAKVPVRIEAHPKLWVLRGLLAEHQHQPKTAARLFWEAVRRDPELHTANYHLGHALIQIKETARAQPFLERAELQQQLAMVLNDLVSEPTNVASMHQAAQLTERLGRQWESAAWAALALQLDDSLPWAHQTLHYLQPKLVESLPQTDLSHQAINRIDLSDLPLHSIPTTPNGAGQGRVGSIGSVIMQTKD